MGILNVTPDSFSDGGLYLDPERAVARGVEMAGEGADVIDVGGESTRPGADPVPPEAEQARVETVVRELRRRVSVPISVDTRRAAVARAALEAGADIVNDVSALRDPAMAEVIREFGAGAVLMHMQGEPATMQRAPAYSDVVAEVVDFLRERLEAAAAAGIGREQVVLDPGIGFGKTPEHNLALLAALPRLAALGRPVLVGVSRKSVVGHLTGRPVHERRAGSLALAVWAVLNGADIVRVHDVRDSCDAMSVADRMAAEGLRHGVGMD